MTQRTLATVAVVALVVAAALAGALLAGAFNDDAGPDFAEVGGTVTVPADPAAGAAVTTSAADPDDLDDVGAAEAVDPDDQPIGAAEMRRVQDAALAAAGGGTVTDVDRSDDPGEAFEVEVVRDGVETDVALDADLDRVRNASYDD